MKIKGKRVILIAPIGCGKDYLLNKIVESYQLTKVVTHTTRPPREGEVNGFNYTFITKEEFEKNLSEGKYLEYQSYKVANGDTWYYATPIDEIKKDNSIIILDKEGFLRYTDTVENTSFYISVFDETERFYRSVKRLGKCTMVDVDEVYRRIRTDENKFSDIHEMVDYVIPQLYSDLTIEMVFKALDERNFKRRVV